MFIYQYMCMYIYTYTYIHVYMRISLLVPIPLTEEIRLSKRDENLQINTLFCFFLE